MGCRVLKKMLDKDVKPTKDLWGKDRIDNADSKVSNKTKKGSYTIHVRQVRGGLDIEAYKNEK
jgi:hypothetical protein